METTKRLRGFEVAKGFEDKKINLPKRETGNAAGYDFECAEEVTIQPLWKQIYLHIKEGDKDSSYLKPKLVSTGVKSYMQEDEGLFLYNRSSNPMKNFLLMSNGVGVVDSDYYSNESNDGHIMFQFINFGLFPKTIKKGDRVGQGIFKKFLKVDNDIAGGKRSGGFGSTGQK